MSKTWANVYDIYGSGSPYLRKALQEDYPLECAYWASMPHNAHSWVATYELWNGNVLRPPVGMRADQTSHRWLVDWNTAPPYHRFDELRTCHLKLERRR